MEALASARKLANHIREHRLFEMTPDIPRSHSHIGATLADAILQAGLNYRTVVLPRVERLKARWPTSSVTSGFVEDLIVSGPHEMLKWNDDEKPRRLKELVNLVAREGIETEFHLQCWLRIPDNRRLLLGLHGIGPKTVDYMFRLVGGQAVAVDRHLKRFVAAVCPSCTAYDDVSVVISFTADLLEIHRHSLDHAIWRLMSTRPKLR